MMRHFREPTWVTTGFVWLLVTSLKLLIYRQELSRCPCTQQEGSLLNVKKRGSTGHSNLSSTLIVTPYYRKEAPLSYPVCHFTAAQAHTSLTNKRTLWCCMFFLSFPLWRLLSCLHMMGMKYYTAHIKVREQLRGVGSSILWCGLQGLNSGIQKGLNSGHQTWQQVPFAAEPALALCAVSSECHSQACAGASFYQESRDNLSLWKFVCWFIKVVLKKQGHSHIK